MPEKYSLNPEQKGFPVPFRFGVGLFRIKLFHFVYRAACRKPLATEQKQSNVSDSGRLRMQNHPELSGLTNGHKWKFIIANSMNLEGAYKGGYFLGPMFQCLY